MSVREPAALKWNTSHKRKGAKLFLNFFIGMAPGVCAI